MGKVIIYVMYKLTSTDNANATSNHVWFSADMEIVVSFATFILLLSSNVKIAPLL